MGAAFPRHPTRAHPHEGNCKRTSSTLHGCFGITNRIPVHGQGTTLPLQANTDEMEALHLTNQRLLRDLEELTRHIQRPQEEQIHHDVPRNVDGEGETSQAKEHDPYKPHGEDHNEEMLDRNNIGNGPILYHQEAGERSWEQRFRDIQQELIHMKETVKGRAPLSMDALV